MWYLIEILRISLVVYFIKLMFCEILYKSITNECGLGKKNVSFISTFNFRFGKITY